MSAALTELYPTLRKCMVFTFELVAGHRQCQGYISPPQRGAVLRAAKVRLNISTLWKMMSRCIRYYR
jgi:hypothetical protein